jgi:hypothetical protein
LYLSRSISSDIPIQLLNQTPFIVLLAYIGSAIGSVFSMLSITRRLVMENSPYFCGLFGAVLIGSGIVGTCVALLLVRKVYELVLVQKIAVAGHCISISLLYLAINYHHQPVRTDLIGWSVFSFDSEITLLILSAFTGFFGHMVIPIGLDLAGDCSFPNNTQAASNGLLLVSGYVQSLLFAGIMQAFSSQVVHCKGYKDSGLLPHSSTMLPNKHNLLGEVAGRLCITYTDYSGKSLTFVLK